MFQLVYWIYTLLSWALYIYMVMLAIYVLLSWFPGGYDSWLGRFLTRFVGPFIRLFDFIPPIFGLDFSPILGFLAITIARSLLDLLYRNLAFRLVG